ncbi:hypothetical protein [Nocardia puris]|uniref:Uncharacterized protein n=1 Tax=Nocardia puris TaxID=208602 RepID=A0A366CUR5_9NOCA|nr:hypothetical protein [Nocardia puris]RBO78307.1 hypothetical protein DFR74_1521 [Nocardia puris]
MTIERLLRIHGHDHWSMRGTKTRWDKPHGNGPIILLYVPTEEARNA